MSLARQQIIETPGTLPVMPENHPNHLNLAMLISSPLSRALETAQILADSIGYPRSEIVTNSALSEWNAGELQGEKGVGRFVVVD